jgi:hypothetical protein
MGWMCPLVGVGFERMGRDSEVARRRGVVALRLSLEGSVARVRWKRERFGHLKDRKASWRKRSTPSLGKAERLPLSGRRDVRLEI